MEPTTTVESTAASIWVDELYLISHTLIWFDMNEPEPALMLPDIISVAGTTFTVLVSVELLAQLPKME